MKSKVNLGIIGAGYWGPNLARNFYQNPKANLKCICDISDERISYMKEIFPAVPTIKNYQDILSNSEIDAVVIALPVEDHFRFAKEVLLAGKHALVEKPLALTVAECEELINISEKNELILMVGHTFEYNAAVNRVREFIENGDLGDIYYIYSQRLNLGRIRQDINVMWNLAPHDVSIILYWLKEEPVSVSAKGYIYLQEELEDVVYINLDFRSGTSANIHVSWLDPNKVRKMTIVGSKKMVVYDDVSSDAKIQVYDKGITKKNINESLGEYDTFGKFQLIHRAGDLLVPKIGFVEPLKIETSHFLECILEGKRPLTDGLNGLRVVKVLAAAQKSFKNDGQAIKIK
jgi:predicted dehydrogenase